MENRRINNDCDDSVRSPSPADCGRRSKHQKLDQSIFPSPNPTSNESVLGPEWELRRMDRQLAILRTKLSETEDTVTQHHKLRKQSEELFEKELNILRTQARVDKETIKQLEEDLDTSMRSNLEARESQAAAESELFQMKTKMKRQIRELVNTNAKTQEDFELHTMTARITIERINPEKRNRESEKPVGNNSQKESDLLQCKSQEQKRKTIVVTAIVTEEKPDRPDIRPAKKPCSPEKVLSSKRSVHEDSSSETTDDDDSSTASSSDNNSSSQSSSEFSEDSSEEAKERKARELRIGHNRILVSSRKFFELDWERNEYSEENPGEWSCRKCSQIFTSKSRIQDHVWAKHYGGKFECPFCISPRTRLAWRYTVTQHIKRKHRNWSHR